jgi:hypothetical protein
MREVQHVPVQSERVFDTSFWALRPELGQIFLN